MRLPDASGPVRRVPPLPDRARPRAARRLLRLPRGALRGAGFGLCGVGVAASIGFFLRPPYNPGFAEHPVVMAVHVALGGVFLALAPLQLVRTLRRRAPAYHRGAGRVLVSIGLVVGGSAMLIGLAFPFSGPVEQVVITGFSAWFLISLVAGFVQARRRRYASHRAWMIRALAIATGIATMRILFLPSLMIFGTSDLATVQALSIAAFTIAFTTHAAAAELYLRRRAAPQEEGP